MAELERLVQRIAVAVPPEGFEVTNAELATVHTDVEEYVKEHTQRCRLPRGGDY